MVGSLAFYGCGSKMGTQNSTLANGKYEVFAVAWWENFDPQPYVVGLRGAAGGSARKIKDHLAALAGLRLGLELRLGR